MRFLPNSLSLGRVGLSSARVADNGDVVFVLKSGGALVTRLIPSGSVKPVLRSGQTVSYADECFMLDFGRLERRGEYTYEKN